MKIGIFGGSFNPVHEGHVRALKRFIEKCELDRALVIPTFLPPHKTSDTPTAFEDRTAMLELALKDVSKAEICSIEKTLYEESGQKSYTKITLEHLKSQYSGEYYLYTGTDMFVTLENWREPEYLFANATVAVMCRDDDMGSVFEYKSRYEKKYGARVMILDGEHLRVSSSEIREAVIGGNQPKNVPESVLRYITENRLYQKRRSIDSLRALAKKELPEKRFLHTLSVEKETRYLADLFCPEFKEELSRAAILHDITKYRNAEEFPDCPLDQNDIMSPETVHAKTGAIFTRNIGENMWRTVMYHTTGRREMSLFEMIIFLADYVEETRKHTSCIEERQRLHAELETVQRDERLSVLQRSVCRVLDSTVKYLTEKQVFIHPLTLDALEYYRTF